MESGKETISPSKNQKLVTTEDSKNKLSAESKTALSVTNSQGIIEDPFGGESALPCEDTVKDTSEVDDKNDSNNIEDDGEDLPDNFFDDFSNNDFMAGLDIVDNWIDDDIEESTMEPYETTNKKDTKKVSDVKHNRSPHRTHRDRTKYEPRYDPHSRGRRRSRHSRDNDRHNKDHYRRRSRSKNRRRSRSKHNSERNPNVTNVEKASSDNLAKQDNLKEISCEGYIDRRRDPEKTKRDIQRDKIRCAKDQEARVFQEQLKVAETGLVPPGTELDVVLKSDKFKEDAVKAADKTKKTEAENKKEIKAKEEENRKEKLAEKRKAEVIPFSYVINHRPRKSPAYARLERERSFSPKRRRRASRSRERERRNRSRSKHADNRDVDLRHRLKEKRERHVHTEFSPVSDKRMSRSPSIFNISPESMVSEREMWLLSRPHPSRTRNSRSCSPISSISLSAGSPKRYKKFSFMEEIEYKLRRKPNSNMSIEVPANTFNMGPPPLMEVPVPHPHEFFQHAPVSYPPNPTMFAGTPPSMCPPPDPYQHQVMMGPPNPTMIPHMVPNPLPLMQIHPTHILPNIPSGMQPFQVPHVPTPPIYDPHQGFNSGQFRIQSNLKDCKSEENQELTKLFEDKKISLSDFLSVSAKPIDPSTPVSIHNKIKVISRCQETIKLLEDPKLTGRFFPKISQHAVDIEKRIEKAGLNQSPMRKAVVVRFNFTVPVNKRGQNKIVHHQPSVCVYLHKLVSILGLSQTIPLTPVPKTEEAPKPSVPVPKPVPPPVLVTIKKTNAFIQTEPYKCEICEIRTTRKFADVHIQTVETSTFDAGTQVSVEDLNKSCTTFVPRGILKNNSSSVQSISHLTPAQLLAQLGNEKKEENPAKPWLTMPKKESFPSGRSYPDHLPGQHFNPENNSRNLFTPSNNDRFNDSFRNINPFSDSYSGGDNPRSSLGNNSSQLGKPPGDVYGSSYPPKPFATNATIAPNRGSNFTSPMNEPRKFDSFYTPGRRFPENMTNANSNFTNWNSPSGRGNPRGLGTNLPMTNNKFFNPRGPN